MRDVLAASGLLITAQGALNVQLSQLAAEENKRNPQLVAALETQVEAAQVKANSAYTHFSCNHSAEHRHSTPRFRTTLVR
jgi:F420-dependent methylenetetrahydromethanopterin dehydrogenase